METTFYDDLTVAKLKRNLTLDLNTPRKKQKTALLSSPDLNMLKLASPELEKLIIQQNGLVTTTPTPTQFIFPKNVTEEQELYARGFVDALAELRNGSEPNDVTDITNYGDVGIRIKEEPQTVPSWKDSPPISPIDMDSQERIKLERKRLRNRVAASKCRKRKLERIARLEDKVGVMKGENSELGNLVNKLREQVCLLKEEVLVHVNRGCQMMVSQ